MSRTAWILGAIAVILGVWGTFQNQNRPHEVIGHSHGQFISLFSRILGSGESSSAHSDKSRSSVGGTAFIVCILRALESIRSDREPLIRDHVAVALHDLWKGDAPLAGRLMFFVVKYVLRSFEESNWKRAMLAPVRYMLLPRLVPIYVDMIAVRTRFLDEQIGSFMGSHKQLVIVGAGLDARSFRLSRLLENENVRVFELDFPEMLGEKQRMFEKAGCIYDDMYRNRVSNVGTDLTLDESAWLQALQEHGFDVSKQTIWLLEGFTGYLTEEELLRLLNKINRLSSSGSVLLATWLGTDRAGKMSTMHRFFTDRPDEIIRTIGWKTLEKTSLGQAVSSMLYEKEDDSYWFTTSQKPANADT